MAEREHAAGSAKLAQESVVDGGDVHIERIVFERGGDCVAGAQGRQHGARGIRGDRSHAGAFGDGAFQLVTLCFGGEEQRGASAHQGRVGKSGWRRFEEGAGEAGEQADVGRAVILHPDRGGAAGAVIAGLLFGLDQGDAVIGAERRGGAGAGNAGADDQDIEGSRVHTPHHQC